MTDLQGNLNGIIREATDEDVDSICQMEQDNYSAEEAGSPTQMRYRLKVARELVLAYEVDGQVAAFIGGIRSDSPVVTQKSMYDHLPNGKTLYIYSVCVKSQFRRKGIAFKLLNHYVSTYLKQNITGVSMINLICHDYLVPLYERAGFKCLGLASIVLGKQQWYECQMIL